MGLGACCGRLGGLQSWKRSVCRRGRPPLPRAPLTRAASASLEKPAAQETAGGAQTAAPPPARRPPAPPPRPPNPPEGAVAARVAPPAGSPHTCGRTIYNSAPIPGLWAGARCASALIGSGISAPPRAGEDKFSLRKLGEHFPKLHVPEKAKQNPCALSLPPSRQPAGGAGVSAPRTVPGVRGAAAKPGQVKDARYGGAAARGAREWPEERARLRGWQRQE